MFCYAAPQQERLDQFCLSIVIPTLNEAEHISQTLASLREQNPAVDCWVVDGGSVDRTVDLALEGGAKVLHCSGGRGAQLNLGAHHAEGDTLLFLHADTQLPPHFQAEIEGVLSQPGVVAGAFPLKIAQAGWGLKLVMWGTQQRSRWLQLPYGDQALFVRRSTFEASGGFPLLPIMEDFVWVRRLQQFGRIALAKSPVLTSDRRWKRLGLVQTTIVNQLMILGYFTGVPPQHLAQWYRTTNRSSLLPIPWLRSRPDDRRENDVE